MAQQRCAPRNLETESFKLISGHSFPAVGLGGWRVGPQASPTDFTAIVEAWYSHVDTAAEYGVQEVGTGMQAAMLAGVNRKELFIASKLGCTYLSPERVRPALIKTLQELQLDYLDLLLIHWLFHLKEDEQRPPGPSDFLDFDMEGVWREMEMLVRDNLVRDIGISNYTIPKLEKLLKFSRTMPSVCRLQL